MATPLDFFSILSQTEPVLQFLFVIFIVYFVFVNFVPQLKEKKNLAGILAFILGLMTVFNPIASRTISLAMPGFVLLFIFLIFLLITFFSLGFETSHVKSVLSMKKWEFIHFILIAICATIFLFAFGKAVTEQGGFSATEATGQEAAFYSTVFHPKVLGMVFVLLVAFFTIQRLGVKPEDI